MHNFIFSKTRNTVNSLRQTTCIHLSKQRRTANNVERATDIFSRAIGENEIVENVFFQWSVHRFKSLSDKNLNLSHYGLM
jgi:hypothetical protein